MSRLISSALIAGIMAIALPVSAASAKDYGHGAKHHGHGAKHHACKKVVKCKGFGHHKRCKKVRICKNSHHR